MRPCRVAFLLRTLRFGVLTCALVWVGTGWLCAQTERQGTTPKKAETVPLKTQASPMSGQDLYKAYCASCHGTDAKGGGPVAESLRMRPTDLTQLSQRNGGKFPAYRVEQLLGGKDDLPVHGSKAMPVWGPAFRALNREDAAGAVRVRNLVSYLESIQAK